MTTDLRIDRLRGFFAICVMLGHSVDLVGIHAAPDLTAALVAPFRGFLGFFWVIGFIVLSGYLIARSCEQRGSAFNVSSYIAMRATRIYPLLFVCAIAAAVLELAILHSPDRPSLWASGINVRAFVLTMAGLASIEPFGSLDPSYTISFELIYYSLWGAAWWLCRHNPFRALTACGLLWIGIYLFRFDSLLGFALVIFICWLTGAAAFIAREQLSRLAKRVAPAVAWIILFTIGYLISLSQNTVETYPTPFNTAILDMAKYLAISGAFALLIASYVASPNSKVRRVDHWLGEISYPLFLIHGPIIIGCGFLFYAFAPAAPYTIQLVTLVAASMAAAMILLVSVERPVMAWRRTLRSANAKPVALDRGA